MSLAIFLLQRAARLPCAGPYGHSHTTPDPKYQVVSRLAMGHFSTWSDVRSSPLFFTPSLRNCINVIICKNKNSNIIHPQKMVKIATWIIIITVPILVNSEFKFQVLKFIRKNRLLFLGNGFIRILLRFGFILLERVNFSLWHQFLIFVTGEGCWSPAPQYFLWDCLYLLMEIVGNFYIYALELAMGATIGLVDEFAYFLR